MSFTLRPYQDDCLSAIRSGHEQFDSIAVEMATGLGKTVLFVKYASSWERGRTLIVCPQIPLISQAAKKLVRETGIWPGIEQAENRSNEHDWGRSPYIVGSKQTLCGRGERYKRLNDVGLVIVDEAHYACTKHYEEMLTWYRERYGAKVLGVSATLKRHDKRAMGQVFDDCVYQYGILDAITDGWLVPIKVTCLQLKKLDLSEVQTVRGFHGKDFNQKQLNEKLENPEVVYEIAEAVDRETRGQKTAIFCASVDEAQAVAELLVDNYGIRADWICADQKRCSKQRRHEILDSFCTDPDGISHVCNVGILTTGWDYPDLMCIVNARPTKSLPLYTQIMGRLTRPCEVDDRPVVDHGYTTSEERQQAIAASRKPFGRMIDLVDNSLQHKIVTATDVLGGRWSLVVKHEVEAELRDKPGAIDPEELALKVEERLKAEEEEQERLRQQRAAKRVRDAQYNRQEVDPFSGRQANGANRSQREMATQKQLGYMWHLGFKDCRKYTITKRQAMRIIGQLKSGVPVMKVKFTNRLRAKGSEPKPSVDQADRMDQVDFDEAFSLFR